jgi:hypothetical protein
LSDAKLIAEVNERLENWQQGDTILGVDVPFIHLADLTRPITPQSCEIAKSPEEGDALANIATMVPGFVVTTQTCDIVRPCDERALLQLAALEAVEPDMLEQIKRGLRPRYAFISGMSEHRLVADLDAVMTVEKAVLAQVPKANRIRGCPTDADARQFASALSRNLSRVAFPDDFVKAVKPIQQRIIDKHGKPTKDRKGNPTNEGELLDRLREIRIACTPSWTDSEARLTFYFVFNSRNDVPADAETIIEDLIKKFKPVGPFIDPLFRVVTLSEMSAAAYVASDPLDLDNLTSKT